MIPGHTVTVYEAAAQLHLDDQNSYPIGVNVRGQETLRRIDEELVDALRAEGEVVEGFVIRAGSRRVAALPSGTLIATTRARLTRLLLERAERAPGIEIATGRKPTGVDLAARHLAFTEPTDRAHAVDATDFLVLCCDGVWSARDGR